MHGHVWTAFVHLKDRLLPPEQEARPWQTTVVDAELGELAITGFYRPVGKSLVVLVHGLGGRSDSGYVVRTARAAEELGFSTLRVALRGADRRGEDFYHAGLTDDLRAALQSPEARKHDRIYVVGFSMGGHVSLRLCAEGSHRVSAFASVCAPLDLEASCTHIDSRMSYPYRRHILSGLKEMYREVARKREWATLSDDDLDAIQRVRDWDQRTIVPRFGFDDADHYYRSCSAGPVLGDIETPTLFVHANADPMVTTPTLLQHLARRSKHVEVRWLESGGHVAFPARAGVDHHVIEWLVAHGA